MSSIADAEMNMLRGGKTQTLKTVNSKLIKQTFEKKPIADAQIESRNLIDDAKATQKRLIIITIVIVVIVGGIAIWLSGRKKGKK